MVALVIAGLLYFGGVGSKDSLFSATPCSGITCLAGGLRLVTDTGGDFESDVAAVFNSTFKLGSGGTAQANQVRTTCSPKADVSIAASTTGYAFCTGVTGVTSADNVLAQFATSTAGFVMNDNWYVVGAQSSTTAGAIDLEVYNASGKAQAPSASSRTGSTTVISAGH